MQGVDKCPRLAYYMRTKGKGVFQDHFLRALCLFAVILQLQTANASLQGGNIMSYVDEVIARVIRENPAEPEFHQAVKEVLESLRPVVDANEERYRRDAILERLVNPERQIKFRVP